VILVIKVYGRKGLVRRFCTRKRNHAVDFGQALTPQALQETVAELNPKNEELRRIVDAELLRYDSFNLVDYTLN
jgi:hypothetical protein